MAVEKTNVSSSLEYLDRLLDKGEVSPQCDCCPCSNIYVFASVETALKFLEAVGWIENQEQCSERSYFTDCCTDNCIDKLEDLYGTNLTDRILDKGVYEYSLLGTKSILCDLYNYLKDNNVGLDDAIDFADRLLDKGVVFQCYGENQILASVETYLKYAEAVGITDCVNPQNPCECLPSEQCCLSVTASVETYLKYAEAVGLTQSAAVPD